MENPIFTSEYKARQYLESVRWPDGPFCPHCGSTENITRLNGESHRPGLHQCNSCREHFTVTVGTVYERSHIPLHKWLYATHLICASKKGISSKQLERMLKVTYKTAWFMSHRIREGMKPTGKLGGNGSTIEADETYVGGKEGNKHRSKRKPLITGSLGKEMVFALVERDGRARSFHLANFTAKDLRPLIQEHVAADTHLMTDGEGEYTRVSNMFLSHERVNHSSGEYVRGNAHTNTIESYFSIFKRGVIGTFHHISAQHLQRYATEFDFRYNFRETRIKDAAGKWQKAGFNDAERAHAALKGIGGKRLTYRRINTPAQDIGSNAH